MSLLCSSCASLYTSISSLKPVDVYSDVWHERKTMEPYFPIPHNQESQHKSAYWPAASALAQRGMPCDIPLWYRVMDLGEYVLWGTLFIQFKMMVCRLCEKYFAFGFMD
jgi:hypothetical protein